MHRHIHKQVTENAEKHTQQVTEHAQTHTQQITDNSKKHTQKSKRQCTETYTKK